VILLAEPLVSRKSAERLVDWERAAARERVGGLRPRAAPWPCGDALADADVERFGVTVMLLGLGVLDHVVALQARRQRLAEETIAGGGSFAQIRAQHLDCHALPEELWKRRMSAGT
jgi:hypothetical protein